MATPRANWSRQQDQTPGRLECRDRPGVPRGRCLFSLQWIDTCIDSQHLRAENSLESRGGSFFCRVCKCNCCRVLRIRRPEQLESGSTIGTPTAFRGSSLSHRREAAKLARGVSDEIVGGMVALPLAIQLTNTLLVRQRPLFLCARTAGAGTRFVPLARPCLTIGGPMDGRCPGCLQKNDRGTIGQIKCACCGILRTMVSDRWGWAIMRRAAGTSAALAGAPASLVSTTHCTSRLR